MVNKWNSLIFFLAVFFLATAQNNSELQKKTFYLDTCILQIDTLPIVPRSFSLIGISSEQYHLDYLKATLTFDSSALQKTIIVSYQRFDIDFTKKFANKSLDQMIEKGARYEPPPITDVSFLDKTYGSSLASKGSIARGFTIGNNQDFVLNSSLNLQLSGFLTKDLTIEANITDKNVPIQPEGNTRIIQDFDQIFIHLNYKDQFRLLAGDINVSKPNGHFLVLDREMLGMQFIANNSVGKHFNLYNNVGGGIARGKYIRKRLAIVNGMQGPYKLTTDAGSQNIVIVSGTEKVYLDNRLLTRGENEDYIMDYNTGEITFTAKIMITSEKEINIEYQYTDLSYSRYSIYTFNTFQHKKQDKWKINLNIFYDQDVKNNSIYPELNDEMKLFLSELNGATDALYPNVDTSSFYLNEILYVKKDTLINGITHNIYVYSTDHTQQLYRLNFTYMGPNRGNYKLTTESVNGRVFEWTAPQNGLLQGDYEPVIVLTTPKSTLMATVGSSYQFLEKTCLSGEVAVSHNNANLFAPKSVAGETGSAVKIDFVHQQKIRSKKKEIAKPWNFLMILDYEFLSKNFTPVESFRDVEFYKDYNLSSDYAESSAENKLEWNASFSQEGVGNVDFGVNYYDRTAMLRAIRAILNSEISKNRWKYSTQTSYLASRDTLYNTSYIRTFNKISKILKKIELGLYERFEHNLFQSRALDSIMPNSFLMNEAYLYLKNNDSLNVKYQFLVKNIICQTPIDNILSMSSMVNEATFELELAQIKNTNLSMLGTYRNEQTKGLSNDLLNENFFIGSIVYSGRYLRNSILLTTSYEAGSGLEQKKSYSFIKVGAGQGTYVWNDYNGNGIEDLDEFEIAAFQQEANYMKVWLPTQDFYNVFSNQFSQFIQLRPSNVWRNSSGIKKFIARFGNSTSLRIQQKNTQENLLKALNPFAFNYSDTLIQDAALQLNNTFSFNQMSQLWGIDYTYQLYNGKNILYYGEEINKKHAHNFLVRVRPVKILTIKANYQFGENANLSFLEMQSYQLKEHEANIIFNIQYNNKMYWNCSYIYSSKNNLLNIEKMLRHDAYIDFSYRWVNIGNIYSKVTYAHISYNGNTNSSLGYTMLDGLQNGHNLLWNVSFQARITEFLQIDLSYDGRVAQKNRAVHTALLQIKALF